MKVNWLVGSVFALLSLGTMSFLITVMTRRGIPTAFILFFICSFYIVYYLVTTVTMTHYKPDLTMGVIGPLIAIAALSTAGNLLLFNAANDAPNPALALAIGGTLQTAVVCVLAFIFLHGKMTTLQMAGLILGIIGTLLINLGSQTK